MLTGIEIERLFVKLGLPETARELVRFARAESPVRKVTSHLGNSVIWQYSVKMGGKHLELESRTVEAPAATRYEEDPDCLEYWFQPFRVDLNLKDKDGKTITRTQHTPDVLTIRRDGFFVHEWREEQRLMRLATESTQFYKDADGRWLRWTP